MTITLRPRYSFIQDDTRHPEKARVRRADQRNIPLILQHFPPPLLFFIVLDVVHQLSLSSSLYTFFLKHLSQQSLTPIRLLLPLLLPFSFAPLLYCFTVYLLWRKKDRVKQGLDWTSLAEVATTWPALRFSHLHSPPGFSMLYTHICSHDLRDCILYQAHAFPRIALIFVYLKYLYINLKLLFFLNG